jgi:CRP-like cAMP-binding protein
MTAEFKPNLVRKIDQSLVELLLKDDRIIHFSQDATLFYEGHIPIVAYLLIERSIEIVKNKKVIQEVTGTNIVGLEHLMYNKTSDFTIIAKQGSSVVYLDKSSLLSTNHKQLKT